MVSLLCAGVLTGASVTALATKCDSPGLLSILEWRDGSVTLGKSGRLLVLDNGSTFDIVVETSRPNEPERWSQISSQNHPDDT